MIKPILTALLLAVPLMALAQVYKTVDEDGNVVYTDDPRGKPAEAVDVPEPNTQPSVSVPEPEKAPKSDKREGAPTDYRVEISSPAEGTQVPPGQRDLAVQVAVMPALDERHRVQLLINGQAWGVPSERTSFTVKEIHRGQHSLAVVVLDAQGRVLARSAPVTVFVHRPTVNSPARRQGAN